MNKILLVEDSEEYQLMVTEALGRQFKVEIVDTVEKAVVILNTEKIDLVVLDITLPTQDGYSLLAKMSNNFETSSIPVICLTSRSQISDKVTAFSLGADDYIVKPFNLIELKIRVESKLKKAQAAIGGLIGTATIIEVGSIRIDRNSMQVFESTESGLQEVILTKTEFDLLLQMAKSPGTVFSREVLIQNIRGQESSMSARTVDVHISSLRKKLQETSHYIVSAQGRGYKLLNRSLRPAEETLRHQ